MKSSELDNETLQMHLVLEAIRKRYGYDFSHYAHASLKRRLREILKKTNIADYYHLIDRVITDPAFFKDLLGEITVGMTSMFRDPLFYKTLRTDVIPVLKSYPSIKIWLAGCSSGEEAYSLAILFKEENLLTRCRIYATDIDPAALEKAKKGILSISNIKLYTKQYNESGGQSEFSNYYHSRYNAVAIHHAIKNSIVFSEHNLIADGVFNAFNLILCRNVMIYFDNALQPVVLNLLNTSLQHYGFLCLGMKETLSCTCLEEKYRAIDKKTKIYQKMVME